NEMRFAQNAAAAYAQCLVPTFGNPASDQLLTATNASITPRVAVGRLSVENPADINIYLNKVKGYELQQRQESDPHQTIDEKLWILFPPSLCLQTRLSILTPKISTRILARNIMAAASAR